MIIALAGGVGGAKLAVGLQAQLGSALVVVVNTADDFEHLGLHISPDLDTVMYTLAGMAAETGWGVAGETWSFMSALEALGGETWFQLGDRDVATHVERSRRLRAGESLSAITTDLCTRLGVQARVVPMTDHPVQTLVDCTEGVLAFQEYFVARSCEPTVTGFRFTNVETAGIAPGFADALAAPELDAVIICPSNPFVSIAPILALPGIRAQLTRVRVPVIAVTPVIGGEAVRGPTAKMMQELGYACSAHSIAAQYADVADGFVLDVVDGSLVSSIEALGLRVLTTNTLMRTLADKTELARATIAFADAFSADEGS